MVIVRKQDDHAAVDRNLPGEVNWQFSNEFTYVPGLFQCSSCTQKDRKRCKVVVISVGVGCGRVPPANPIQCDRDRDLHRQLPWLPARSVCDFLRTARLSIGHSNPSVPHDTGVRPPLQSKQNADYPSIVSLPNDRSRKDRLMKRRKLIALSAVFVTAIATLLISSQSVLVSAQNASAGAQKGDREAPPPPLYNPYPPGILPPDLPQEIERVRREVDNIENEALAQWQALTPPTLTGQPPILAHTGQRANVLLGKLMNFDEHISPFGNRACAFCHMPYAGFSGSIPSVNLTMIAYPGSFQFRAGKRTAQRYTYSPD